MTEDSVLEDSAPLQTQHIPSNFIDRTQEQNRLKELIGKASSQNLFLHGRKGSGKTHLTLYRLNQLPGEVNTCYIPGKRCRTQYKTLKQLYHAVTGEDISSGHHTAKLQREIKERTTQLRTVVVLDDIEFLLMNDGDSLLYQLSRTNPQKLCLVLISSQIRELSQYLEERTLSSLQPRKIKFTQYTGEEVYQVLAERSRDSFKPQTVHREALTYIASQTQNTSKALHWLKAAAQNTENQITEETVSNQREPAYQSYIEEQLKYFSQHHRLLHQAIQELEEEHGPPIKTGKIYQRYKELSQSYSEDPVSNRQVSTYLKHLEHLNLLKAKYHYGGTKGKTREIRLNKI